MKNIQKVAFLPVLPFKITEYDTVYTAMCTFIEILSQLGQEYFPLFCDKGVYCTAKHIQLINPEKIAKLLLIMGSFHMIKIVCTCIGKYLNESGADSIFIETEIFGPSVVQQVLEGSHYTRSTKGFLCLERP